MKTMHSRRLPVIVLSLAVLVLSLPLFSQQAVIDLGLAGNLVILANDGVTNTGTSNITGHVGVVALHGQLTGFDETVSEDLTYATSAIVNGKIYTGSRAAPTPAQLDQAASDMDEAYLDGSTRSGAVYENTETDEAQVLDSGVLAAGPGLYQWAGSVNVESNINISSANANAVWIFKVHQLKLSQDVQITLGGAAQAKNIFWLIDGGATIEEYSHITGTVLSLATIAFGTGASMYGKALSYTNVTLLSNTLTYDGVVPETLPVNLSSFTAGVTANGLVTLQWTAETETNMLGYNVYRNNANVLAEAAAINSGIIPAKNNSVAAHYDFTDEAVVPGSTYYYWLQSMDLDLSNTFHGPVSVQVAEEGEGGSVIPPELTTKLIGAYPNPFNPSTTIKYTIKEETGVSLGIYNLQGQIVRILVDGVQRSGDHSIAWDGTDYTRKAVGSGVYFYRLKAGRYESVNKMILLK